MAHPIDSYYIQLTARPGGAPVADMTDTGYTSDSSSLMTNTENGSFEATSTAAESTCLVQEGPKLTKNVTTRSYVTDADSDEIVVFVEPPNKSLICIICHRIFTDPVIVSCGHTYCRGCVSTHSEDQSCPVDKQMMSIVLNNIAVCEQVGELLIHCKNGCQLSDDGVTYVNDVTRCPVTVKLSKRREHESTCDYSLVSCPNNVGCLPLLKKDLDDHLKHCNNAKCPYYKYSCPFQGTQDELEDHLKECKFEFMKGFIERTEDKMADLNCTVLQKDQEIGFLRTMLGKLSERLERLEKLLDLKIDIVEENQNKLMTEVIGTKRECDTMSNEIQKIHNFINQGYVGALDPQQIFKCKGTCVGHSGPVWCLTVSADYLFSGSSDKTIKVWDTSASYRCVKTLEGHTAIVLSVCVWGNRLYSGSQDCNVIVWLIERLEQEKVIEAHNNPVCTLAAARNMLFSGTLKVIKVWDAQTHDLKKEITGINHWVRALVANDRFLFSGSYQTIKLWDLETLECIQILETQGGSVYSITVTNRYILCGTYENCIHVWEVGSYKPVTTLLGHTGTIYALAVMDSVAAGTKVFSASYDRSIRVWSMENMICTQTLARHDGSVACLAVSRGRVFSGAVDNTVKVWQ